MTKARCMLATVVGAISSTAASATNSRSSLKKMSLPGLRAAALRAWAIWVSTCSERATADELYILQTSGWCTVTIEVAVRAPARAVWLLSMAHGVSSSEPP